MSVDDEWEWQSCGSVEDSESVSSKRDGRVRLSTSRVVAKVERTVGDLDRVREQLAIQHDESMRWRYVTIAMLLLQCLQLIPTSVRDAFSSLVSRAAQGALTLRALGTVIAAHLVYSLVRKLVLRMRNNTGSRSTLTEGGAGGGRPAVAAHPARSAPRVTVIDGAPPAPAEAAGGVMSKTELRSGIPNALLDRAVEGVRRSITRPAPEIGSLPELSKAQRHFLDLIFHGEGWKEAAATDTQRWLQLQCDWNGGHIVGRYESVLNCSADFFIHEMIDSAPRAQKVYDPLFESYNVVQDKASEGGRVLHLSFQTPVNFVAQRDVCMFVERYMLSDAEVGYYGLDTFIDELRRKHSLGTLPTPAPLESRVDFGAPVLRPMVLASISVDHPECPEKSGYTRAHMSLQGYSVLPIDADHCYIVETVGLDPRGTLPTWAASVSAKRVFERFGLMVKYLNTEYKKKLA